MTAEEQRERWSEALAGGEAIFHGTPKMRRDIAELRPSPIDPEGARWYVEGVRGAKRRQLEWDQFR